MNELLEKANGFIADFTKNAGLQFLWVISQVKDIDIIITTKKLSDMEQKRFSNDGIDVFMV
jgi:DeoR/GlpR family transcriptional regulator of sugar metabolism